MTAATMIYVVVGSRGEYSDRSEWEVFALTDEKTAQDLAMRCQREVRALVAAWKAGDWDFRHDPDKLARFMELCPDPAFTTADGTDEGRWQWFSPEDFSYRVNKVPLGLPACVSKPPLTYDMLREFSPKWHERKVFCSKRSPPLIKLGSLVDRLRAAGRNDEVQALMVEARTGCPYYASDEDLLETVSVEDPDFVQPPYVESIDN